MPKLIFEPKNEEHNSPWHCTTSLGSKEKLEENQIWKYSGL